MAFPLHHCHKSCGWLACLSRSEWSWVAQVIQSNKVEARDGPNTGNNDRGMFVDRSKMFRQHLKCSLTAPRRAGTSSVFFFFWLLSQLSEPGRLGPALSGPASRLASAMTFSGCDTSPTVDCCSFSICRTQSPEELGRVGERSLGWTDSRAATLTFFFFFFNAYAEKERGGLGLESERGETNPFSAGVTVTAPTTMHAEERQRECSQRHSEVRAAAGTLSAGALSGSERIAPYRLDQSRVEAYTTGFSQTSIFIPSPFSGRTNGTQWCQGESKFLPCFS